MYTSKICILCLSRKPFSKEHIIPNVIGGRLTSKILCRDCNSRMGTELEKTFKTDPMIKIALETLKDVLPLLYKDFIKGSKFEGYDKNGKKIEMKQYKDGLKIKTKKEENNSIIVETSKAPVILKGLTGHNKIKESRAYDERIFNLKNNKILEVAEGINIKKGDITLYFENLL